jgi:hypothetical protein
MWWSLFNAVGAEPLSDRMVLGKPLSKAIASKARKSLRCRRCPARSLSAMTIAHKLGDGIDCALGRGVHQKDWCSQHNDTDRPEDVTELTELPSAAL